MDNAKNIISSFIEFARKRQLPRAIVRDIPTIGHTLENLIFGTERKSIDEITNEFESVLESKIIPWIQNIINDYENPQKLILVIGSGVLENIYQLPVGMKIHIGQKHIAERKELLGGSGINYTFRLMNMKHFVFPILSIGKDTLGNKIQSNIASEMNVHLKHTILRSLVNSDDFKCDGLVTPQSTIVVSGEDRTILTEELGGKYDFIDFMDKQIENIERIPGIEISAVMIGHIYADDPAINENLNEPGVITKHIIDKFHNKAFIYTNLGNSQLKQGFDFWEKYLSKVDVFQLSISEIKKFLSIKQEEHGEDITSLSQIIKFLQTKEITSLITIDKFGAIANFKNGEDGIILCWPFELTNFLDSTGAGDAFGAGMMANLYQLGEMKFGHFYEAIREGRAWSAYACTTLGGSDKCPDKNELNTFKKITPEFGKLDKKRLDECEYLFKLVERSYF